MGGALIMIRDFEHAGIVGCLSAGLESGGGNPDDTRGRSTLRAYGIVTEQRIHTAVGVGGGEGGGAGGGRPFYCLCVRDHSISYHIHQSSKTSGFQTISVRGDIDLTAQIQYDLLLGGGTSASPASGTTIVPIFFIGQGPRRN